jgi:hypothetical protein
VSILAIIVRNVDAHITGSVQQVPFVGQHLQRKFNQNTLEIFTQYWPISIGAQKITSPARDSLPCGERAW